MYAVIATFDEKTTNRVKEIWRQIEKFTGVSMEGLDPHITFGDYYHMDEKAYLQKLKQFTKHTNVLSVVFSSIGIFPSTDTIFLAPVMTKELQHVHRSFHECFRVFLDNKQSYYVPDKWVPHCTIASRVDKQQYLRIIEHMYSEFRVEQAVLQTMKVISRLYLRQLENTR